MQHTMPEERKETQWKTCWPCFSLQLQSYQDRISKKDDRSKESSNQRSTNCMHVWYGNTHSYPERFFLFAALLADILTGRGTVDC